jgi:hypothetical protein
MIGQICYILALSASERFKAAQTGLTERSGSGGWFWLLLAMVAFLALVGSLWGLWAHVVGRRKRAWEAFVHHSQQLGLSDEEQNLLHSIAIGAQLPQVDLIFTSAAAFNQGVSALGTDNSADSFGNFTRLCSTCTYIQTLREKLGFHAPAQTGKPSAVNLGKVADGTILTIMRQRGPESFQAAVVTSSPSAGELLLQPEGNVVGHVGESWLIRFPEGGILWEFNGWVIRTEAGKVTVKPSGTLRWINRRKFVRTPTNKRAFVATFPFDRSDDLGTTPEFVPASLLEIAGPGLLLRAPVSTVVGERVLVVVELHRRKTIEGMALVRRVSMDETDGESTIAIELVNLSTSEVAELAKETNMVHSMPDEPEPELAAALEADDA